MKNIDKTKPVLVTGATGYIAGWLVKKLLEEGITVHATVRNPDKKEKLKHLDEIASNAPGEIKYFKADLLTEGAYAEAMKDCELVFHTASPFALEVKNPQKDLIEPALLGTRNVLTEATKTPSVKRVVVTSSCAAIYSDANEIENIPNNEFTEEIWNTTASEEYQPYSYSKTLAEREAWKIADGQEQWDLVVINPSMVLGPALNTDVNMSESVSLIKQLGDGTLKMGAPNLGIGAVDVRDVALAHFKAGYTPNAYGRHITSAHNTSFLEIAQILNKNFGDKYPIPNKAVPKWLLMVVGPLVNKALTRKFIRNNINYEWKANNSKIKKELSLDFRPFETTLVETFKDLEEHHIISPKK